MWGGDFRDLLEVQWEVIKVSESRKSIHRLEERATSCNTTCISITTCPSLVQSGRNKLQTRPPQHGAQQGMLKVRKGKNDLMEVNYRREVSIL